MRDSVVFKSPKMKFELSMRTFVLDIPLFIHSQKEGHLILVVPAHFGKKCLNAVAYVGQDNGLSEQKCIFRVNGCNEEKLQLIIRKR